MGDLDGEDYQVRTICKDAGVVIVSVDYRLAPKHPYPAPLNDCIEAYEWVLKNSALLKTTPNRAITFGTSAGGNLALATALNAIEKGLTDTLVGVVAIAPVTVDPNHVPEKWRKSYTSYDEHAENTINTKRAMEIFFGIYSNLIRWSLLRYIPDEYKGDGKDPYVSPLLHKNLKSLPRVYLVGCSQDTLRDDARLFKLALEEAECVSQYHVVFDC
jgi:versiconal hemiacetal acetate esterase